MKTVCCIKRVPDTTTRVKVGAGGAAIDRAGVEYVVNPYDEYAIEAAVKLREQTNGECIAVCLGPPEATKDLRTALAMGADRAIHLVDENAETRDSFSTAKALADALRPLQFDVAFFGKQSIDADNYQVGTMVARLLGIPSASVVVGMEVQGNTVVCSRAVEGGVETIPLPVPCIVTCQKGINVPRYPALKGIMSAKKKPLESIPAPAISNRVVVSKMELPPPRPAGKVLKGDAAANAREVVRLLREEAKII
ncbi:MAG: electron transfer flavoprotein subunit beta/FixA family protein [Planctomycetes bacterium]|nr:electron transfer flavoprotein subunit beta/FixA family protein [Planctomycetota bacterium]